MQFPVNNILLSKVEYEILFLLKQTRAKRDKTMINEQLFRNTVRMWNRNEKISCIKHVRSETNCGLFNAKNFVEAVWSCKDISTPIPLAQEQTPVFVHVPDVRRKIDAMQKARKQYLAAINLLLVMEDITWQKTSALETEESVMSTVVKYLNLHI